MSNIEYAQIETPNGIKDIVIIDRGNDEYTSMSKDIYDAQQTALNAKEL